MPMPLEVILLQIFGGLTVGFLVPGLLGSVLSASWWLGIRYVWLRKFGGERYPPIVWAMEWMGPMIFWRVLGGPFLPGLVFSILWFLLIEFAWDQRFRW